MARITVEDCLKKENNRFALVVLAFKRAKQLLSGAKSTLPEVKNKPIVTALREIANSDVHFMSPEEQARVREERRAQEEAAMAAAMAATEPVVDDGGLFGDDISDVGLVKEDLKADDAMEKDLNDLFGDN